MSEKTIFIVNAALTGERAGLDRIPAPITGTLDEIHLLSDNVISGGDALFDANKNGTTIWSDQTQRVKIASGASAGSKTGLAIAVTQFADFISVDFDEFTGSAASVGGKLYILLIFNEAGGGARMFAKVKLNAAQTTFNAESDGSLVNWRDNGEVVRDDGDFVDSGQIGFVIPASGPYDLLAQVRWAGNATGIREIWLAYSTDGFDETFVGYKSEVSLGTTAAHRQQCAAKHYFEAGWIVFVKVFQNSGGTLDLEETNDESWFAITPAGRS